MNVLDLLCKRTQYLLTHVQDEWIKEAVSSDEDEIAVILRENEFTKSVIRGEYTRKLLAEYSLKAMFDVGSPYANISLSFCLYVFTKKLNCSVLYGLYKKSLKGVFSDRRDFNLSDNLPEDYLLYINNIEEFLSTGVCPEDNENYEFGQFDSAILDNVHWTPYSYSKEVRKSIALINEKECVRLGDVADIIKVNPLNESTNNLLTPGNWKYPFDYSGLREGHKTDCPLKKGDVIFLRSDSFFLVYEEPECEIYSTRNGYIIRVKDERFCPEYLYLCMQSDFMQALLRQEEIGCMPMIKNKAVLENLPVPVPEKELNSYRFAFYSENFPISYLDKLPEEIRNRKNISEDSFVFISYSTKEYEIAEQTKRILEANGIPCWMAPQSIPAGSDYAAEIPRAIANCKALLLILSEASQESNWVPKEVGSAIGKGKTIVPFHIDNSIINDSFNFYLLNSQRISAYNRMTDAYQELIKRLVNILS